MCRRASLSAMVLQDPAGVQRTCKAFAFCSSFFARLSVRRWTTQSTAIAVARSTWMCCMGSTLSFSNGATALLAASSRSRQRGFRGAWPLTDALRSFARRFRLSARSRSVFRFDVVCVVSRASTLLEAVGVDMSGSASSTRLESSSCSICATKRAQSQLSASTAALVKCNAS